MPCSEIMELERIWEKRFERAKSMETSGMFAVSVSMKAPTMRQLRAKQAQAAHAILMHQRQCQMCNSDSQAEPFMWSDSLAS